MKPSFIGLGAQKCATAWLYNMLKDHPDIEMVTSENGKKDLSFFNHFYDRGFEWYEKHFVDCNTNTFGEFSTSYLYNTDVPERIYNYSAEVKLIVSLRNPVERAFSNHKHEINLGHISGKNLIFENALQNNPMYLYQSQDAAWRVSNIYLANLLRKDLSRGHIALRQIGDLQCRTGFLVYQHLVHSAVLSHSELSLWLLVASHRQDNIFIERLWRTLRYT